MTFCRHTGRLDLGLRAVATALVVCFSLAVLTTDADHCLEECERTADQLTSDPGHHHRAADQDRAGTPSRSLAQAETPEVGDDAGCLGAGCLCHQPRLIAALSVQHDLGRGIPTCPAEPPTPPIGAAFEILHIPKSFA